MVMTIRPREWSKPAERAAALPKLRRSRTSLTRGSRSWASRTRPGVPSPEPSSTKTISKFLPSRSSTAATRGGQLAPPNPPRPAPARSP